MAIESPHKGSRDKKFATTATYSRTEKGRYSAPRVAGTPALYKSPTLSKESQWENNRTPRKNIDDLITPVTTILSSNITPRSGSRKARVDSASSTPVDTPSGTPIRSRPTFTVSLSTGNKSGSAVDNGTGSKGLEGQVARPSASSTTDGSKAPSRTPLQATGRETISPEEPKFFHASQANDLCRASRSLSQRTNPQQPKSPCFFYANGEVDAVTPASSRTTSPLTNEVPLPRLFHRRLEKKPDSRAEAFSPLGKTVAQVESPRTLPKQEVFSPGPLHRPPSPLKEVSVARKGSKPSSPRSSVVSSNQPLRRSSLKSAVQTPSPHSRSKSVAPSEPLISPCTKIPNVAGPLDLDTFVSGALVQEPTSQDARPLSLPIASAQSPIKTAFDSNHDLAASARRERKVLDLEISNSSLLAINRTLEREMRKQHNELRRYRRLTQAGRLSLVRSNRSVSTQRLSTLDSEDSELLDGEESLDLDISEFDDEEDEDGESTLSSAGEPLFPSTRQRAKDAKRLQLDLSKHHELLVDSQKLNQSIKRCLGWTDALIQEGKKALANPVPLSEMEATGGRVLRREEIGLSENQLGRRSALLSPGLDGVEDFVSDESATMLDVQDMVLNDEDMSGDHRESVLSMISSPKWKRKKHDLGAYGDDSEVIGTAI